jgi:hypothetical protein
LLAQECTALTKTSIDKTRAAYDLIAAVAEPTWANTLQAATDADTVGAAPCRTDACAFAA